MEVADVPPALRERLGNEATVSLLALLETARQEWIPEVTTAAVERFERRIGDEVGSLRVDFRDGLTTVRQEMHAMEIGLRTHMRAMESRLRSEMQAGDSTLRDEIAQLRSEVREGFARISVDNANARFELLKWAFVFWVGQVFAVASVMALVMRLMRV